MPGSLAPWKDRSLRSAPRVTIVRRNRRALRHELVQRHHRRLQRNLGEQVSLSSNHARNHPRRIEPGWHVRTGERDGEWNEGSSYRDWRIGEGADRGRGYPCLATAPLRSG